MKSGASDPFADEESETDEESAGEISSGSPTEESPATDAGSEDESGAASESEREDGEVDARSLSREELPLVLRRDRVKDERPEVHQLFVQADTHERAVEAERELESRLDADLARTDAREAIYLAGMSHLDEAAAILREWGYDL